MNYSSFYIALELPFLIEEIYMTLLASYPYSEFQKRTFAEFKLEQLKIKTSNNEKRDLAFIRKCEALVAEINCYENKEKFFQSVLDTFETKMLILRNKTITEISEVIKTVGCLFKYYKKFEIKYKKYHEYFFEILKQNQLVSEDDSNLINEYALEMFKLRNPHAAFGFELLRTKLFIIKSVYSLLKEVDFLNE